MKIVLVKSIAEKPWRNERTYQVIEDALRENWDVSVLQTSDVFDFYSELEHEQLRHGEDLFVFNIAEYLDENEQFGFIPALLDDNGVKHLGSSAEVVQTGLDKNRTKTVLNDHGIPTPQALVAYPFMDERELILKVHDIGYPVFAKPLSSGGHLGVDERSIIESDEALLAYVEILQRMTRDAVLVEKFVTGDDMREFSVGVVGNETALYTPIEIDYEAMGVKDRILSFSSAQNDQERIKPVLDAVMREKLITTAQDTFAVLGAHDYSRVDLRMDNDELYVLEINIMPGMGMHSFLPTAMAEMHGMEFPELIQHLTQSAIDRYE